MGAIPQRIYERIKEILGKKADVGILLVPENGEIKEAIELPITVTSAKEK